MLSDKECNFLRELLSDNLITIGMFNEVSEADDDDVSAVIVRLMAEKAALLNSSQRLTVPGLTGLERFVCKVLVDKDIQNLNQAAENFEDLLSLWQRFLETTEVSQEYNMSIILSQRTLDMIMEYSRSKRPGNRFSTVDLVIKNIFVSVKQKISESTWNYLKESFGATVTADSARFIKEAEGTMVICDYVDPEDSQLLDLLSEALYSGIFLIINHGMKLHLMDSLAFKEAIDNGPVEDGQAVAYWGGKLFTKPFNPLVTPITEDIQYKSMDEDQDIENMIKNMFSGKINFNY